MTEFEFTDFVGFAKILNVEPETIKSFILASAAGTTRLEEAKENLVVQIGENFEKKTRKERRELLKLAKQVREENRAEKQI